jgi:UDP-N-acetylmuramyl pentapeptide phosphotransferase/UDP-N-acetylglucosamine-1-phosphate transferase
MSLETARGLALGAVVIGGADGIWAVVHNARQPMLSAMYAIFSSLALVAMLMATRQRVSRGATNSDSGPSQPEATKSDSGPRKP